MSEIALLGELSVPHCAGVETILDICMPVSALSECVLRVHHYIHHFQGSPADLQL